jgi:hypothetical protein
MKKTIETRRQAEKISLESAQVPAAAPSTPVPDNPSSVDMEIAGRVPFSNWRPEHLIGKFNSHYVFLILLPWFLFLINPNWPFQGFGHIDPWYYFGMSVNFPRYQHLVLGYSGERLTWLLPARLFVSLFTPAYGWLLLHICFYSTSTLCLYSLVRNFAGSAAALTASTMMAVHPFFIGSNGWSYVESGCITYLLMSFVALAASRRPEVFSYSVVLAGMFWAANAYNYFLYWALTPCCFFFYWAISDPVVFAIRRGAVNWRHGIRFLSWFVVGIGITTLLMICASDLIYGGVSRFFYAGNWGAAMVNLTLKKGQNTWGSQNYDWIRTGGWIFLPILTFIASVVAAVRHYFFGVRLPRVYLGILMVYSYAFLLLAYLTTRENQILQFDYYASILIPMEFLALGVLVFRAPSKLSARWLWTVLLTSSAICVAPLWKVGLYLSGLGTNLLNHYLLGLAAIFAGLLWRRRLTWSFALVGLAVGSFGLIPAYPGVAWNYSYNGMAAFKRVAEAIRTIDANTPPDSLPMLWFDNYTDPNTVEYRAVMAGLQVHGYSMQKFPAVDQTKHYAPGTEVVIITRNKDVFPGANEIAAQAGMPLMMRRQELITGDGFMPGTRVSYWLTFTEVLPQPKFDPTY